MGRKMKSGRTGHRRRGETIVNGRGKEGKAKVRSTLAEGEEEKMD